MSLPKSLTNEVFGSGTTQTIQAIYEREKEIWKLNRDNKYEPGMKFHAERMTKAHDLWMAFVELEHDFPLDI
jgi:hypothetical protein